MRCFVIFSCTEIRGIYQLLTSASRRFIVERLSGIEPEHTEGRSLQPYPLGHRRIWWRIQVTLLAGIYHRFYRPTLLFRGLLRRFMIVQSRLTVKVLCADKEIRTLTSRRQRFLRPQRLPFRHTRTEHFDIYIITRSVFNCQKLFIRFRFLSSLNLTIYIIQEAPVRVNRF